MNYYKGFYIVTFKSEYFWEDLTLGNEDGGFLIVDSKFYTL